jgi:hypothetical protein
VRRPRETREPEVVGEPRWPPVLAVLTFVALSVALRLVLPSEGSLGPTWVIPSVEGVLVVALLAGDPGRFDRRATWLRRTLIAMVGLLVAASLWATVVLTARLIEGGGDTNSAGALLAAGSVVLAGNNLAFALLYWAFDCGGPAVRAHGMPAHPDFAFPQQLNPDLATPGWRPAFVDYLYLGFTNSAAFSPTDAMPLAPWAKISMAVQATISLALLGLVIARAVNVFS